MLSSSKKQRAAKLWRGAVRNLFSNRCFVCSEKEPPNPTELSMFHCHHIVNKGMGGNLHAAYKLPNGCLLCPDDHRRAHCSDGKHWLGSLIKSRFPDWHAVIENLRTKPPERYTEAMLDEDIRALKEVT